MRNTEARSREEGYIICIPLSHTFRHVTLLLSAEVINLQSAAGTARNFRLLIYDIYFDKREIVS